MTPVIERSQAWRSLFACVTIGCGVTLAGRGVSESWWIIVIGAAHLAAIWLKETKPS